MKSHGKGRLLWATCTVSMVVFLAGGTLYASADKEPAQIGANDWEVTPVRFWYVPSAGANQGKPTAMMSKIYTVTSDWIATHCQTDKATKLNHFHYEKDFDQTNQTSPKATESDAYWNARFSGAALEDNSHATTKLDCHASAFKNYADADDSATPYYEYASAPDAPPGGHGWDKACADDRGAKLQQNNLVASGCFLFYRATAARPDHTSVVHATRAGSGNREPSILRWKWRASGVYRYTTPDDGTNEFYTPMCWKGGTVQPEDEVDDTKLLTNQGWAWDKGYQNNLEGVYPDD